jgi:hypothetical protein
MPPLCGSSSKRERPLAFEEERKEMSVVVPKTRGKGRPPKADLIAVKERNKGKIGRPVGDAGRIQEFKERLLATGGTRILDKMISIALNDDHPGQMAAIKLAVDRVLPMSLFEASKQGGNVPTISINISSMAAPVVETVEDITDV